MALHSDVRSMAVEAVDEYLAIAEHCVNTRKANGGVYGYPAVLLLFCIIYAGNWLGQGRNTLRGAGLVIPGLPPEQIKDLKNWYRNLPAHPGHHHARRWLDDPNGSPVEFGLNGEPTHIRLIPFCRAVRSAWESFPREAINPTLSTVRRPTSRCLQRFLHFQGIRLRPVKKIAVRDGCSRKRQALWKRRRAAGGGSEVRVLFSRWSVHDAVVPDVAWSYPRRCCSGRQDCHRPSMASLTAMCSSSQRAQQT